MTICAFLRRGAAGAALGVALALSGCGDGVSPRGEATSVEIGDAPAEPIDYALETVAGGLDLPWSVAFLPDGGVLVTERPGAVKHVSAGGAVETIFDFADLADHPVHIRAGFQAGLFEVALHPEFASNGLVYFSYAGAVGDSDSTLMLMRFRLVETPEGLRLEDGERLFEARPARFSANHYGGRIAFLPDGTLLLPHGEAFHLRERAQELDNHFGKLIRLADDGSIPPDNPFLDRPGALPEIYSYGHRNPQGLLVDPDGTILMHEHGPAGGDELNRIEPGGNYGWPLASYGLDYSGARVSPFVALDGTVQPILHYTPSIAPSGFARYQGDAFPAWRGDLFIGALAKRHVRRIDVRPDGSFGDQTILFGELGARIRDVRSGPDGYLYLLAEDPGGASGKLIRVTPKR